MTILWLFVLVSTSLQLINPQIVRNFIDIASGEQQEGELMTTALWFIGVALLAQLSSVAATYLGEKIAWRATNELRGDLMEHAMKLDLSFHHQTTPGTMIERIDGDVTVLANFFSQFGVRMISNLLLLIGMLVILFQVNWVVGLSFTLFSLVSYYVLNKMRHYAVSRWGETRQNSANLFGFLEERLAGTEDVRSNGAAQFVMRRLFELSRVKMKSDYKAHLAWVTSWNVTIVLFAVATAMALAFGAYLYWQGSATLGTVFLMYMYVNMLRTPVEQISQQIQDLQRAQACIKRTQELLHTESKIADGAGASLPAGALEVEFANVDFSYAEDQAVFKGLSFRLEAGKSLGLLGRTGSGKSTIAQMLLRFYDPSSGSIRLGGVELKQMSLHQLRSKVAMVTQDVQLFSGTVRDNLTFFDRSITDQQILHAFESLGLTEWFQGLPSGLDTELGAGGAGFSAGQAQLLAFTRIYLRDPGLVIFDEASSRLDPATEQLLSSAVGKLLENRTGIIIAHRLQTIQTVDQILILEQGGILEQGTREELCQQPDSRFAQLLQTGMEVSFA